MRPLLADTGAETVGTFLMGTVKGDVHDIGKNLVDIMLEGAGFKVVDLGVQVAPETFIEAIHEHKPDVVGFSAFLTTTMPMFKVNIEAIEKAGLRDDVIIMVGGAPVTQEYADVVGADGYAADAAGGDEAREGAARAAPRARARLTPARASQERGAHAHRSPVSDPGGRHRTRPAVLHHRRADQPDRAQGLRRGAPGRRSLQVVEDVEDRSRRARTSST